MMQAVYFLSFNVLISLVTFISAQTCHNATEYSSCSSNSACGCLMSAHTDNDGICSYLYVACSELNGCAADNRTCFESDHTCLKHPRCGANPLCLPNDMISQTFCPPMPSSTSDPSLPHDGICAKSKWKRDGIIVAEGGDGSDLDHVSPSALFVDNDDVIYVADRLQQRILKWIPGATHGALVAGGNGKGNDNDQFEYVTKLVVDKNGTMFICDRYNRRVQRWFKNENHGETILDDILCNGLALDDEGSLYISDSAYDRVRKWPSNETVAGGHMNGFGLEQLNDPQYIFVDRYKSVYIADNFNYRVVKWSVGDKEGVIVAGGNEQGVGRNQFMAPRSVVVDDSGTVYVLDYGNDRVTRWFLKSPSGIIILGRPSFGDPDDTSVIYRPTDMTIDRHGNLYVIDDSNERILKFLIDKSACVTSKFL